MRSGRSRSNSIALTSASTARDRAGRLGQLPCGERNILLGSETTDGLVIVEPVHGVTFRPPHGVQQIDGKWTARERFIQRFNAAGRPGAYLRIVEEGVLEASDKIVVSDVPLHGLTVGAIARIYRDREGAERLLDAPTLSDAWKAWATRTDTANSEARP